MGAGESRSGSEGDGPGPSAGGRVLVVDDSALARKFVKKALAGHGYDVEVADGGSEALQKHVAGWNDGGDARARGSLADHELALAVAHGGVTDPHPGDVGDRVGGARREDARTDP